MEKQFTEEEIQRAKDFIWKYLEPFSKNMVVYKSNPENQKDDEYPVEEIVTWLHITMGFRHTTPPPVEHLNKVTASRTQNNELG